MSYNGKSENSSCRFVTKSGNVNEVTDVELYSIQIFATYESAVIVDFNFSLT